MKLLLKIAELEIQLVLSI